MYELCFCLLRTSGLFLNDLYRHLCSFRDKLRPKCLLISWKLVCSHSLNSGYGMNYERRNQFTKV